MKLFPPKLLFLALLTALTSTSFVQAEEARKKIPVYFRLSGLGFQNVDSEVITRTTNPIVETRVFGKTVEFDSGFGLSAAMGFKTDYSLNTELEFTGRWMDLGDLRTTVGTFDALGDLQSYSFMFNIPYMFHNSTRLTPYLGAGIGFAWQRGNIENIGDSTITSVKGEQTVIAYQILAGVYYALDRQWDVMLGYRFFGTPDPEYNTLQLENRSHNVELGVRYHVPDKKLERKKRAFRKGRARKGSPRNKMRKK